MGTISDKLTYLNTTKTMLRDSLNKFGSSILSTDTFRSYDTKLNEIYDKLPKVTATGQGLTISNVQNGLLDDFKMNGVDLEQSETPTPDYPQEIKVVEGRQVITDKGKNLFDKDNEIVGCVYNSSGTLVSSGNWNTNNEFKEINNNKISLSCKTTYPISFLLIEFDSNKNFIRRQQSTTTSYTFTLNNNTKYLRFCYLNNVGTYDIQIEESSTATDYEPYYNPVSYNIDLNLENIYLAKIPNTDYKNRVYKNNGNWYYEEKVKKVVLNGSENWSVRDDSNVGYLFQLKVNDIVELPNSVTLGTVIANRFPTSTPSQLWTNNINGISNLNNGTYLRVRIQDSPYTTVNDFKNWLSTYNVIVYYALATPVTTQITNTTLISQLEAISVHTGTNIITISNDNNIIPEIEITRLKELEKLA